MTENQITVLSIYQEIGSYAKTGNLLGISKQRVFQIVTYGSNVSIPSKTKRKLGNTCEVCETVDDLEFHHINGIHTDNRIQNIRRLCRRCHVLSDMIRRRVQGKLKKREKLLKPYNCSMCHLTFKGEARRKRGDICLDCYKNNRYKSSKVCREYHRLYYLRRKSSGN